MSVHRDKPDRWKDDIARSVGRYNDWFFEFTPVAYRDTRIRTTTDVEATLRATKDLTDIGVILLKVQPGILPTLRLSACPPLAVDRLVGLSDVSKTLVNSREKKHSLPPQTREPLIKSVRSVRLRLTRVDRLHRHYNRQIDAFPSNVTGPAPVLHRSR